MPYNRLKYSRDTSIFVLGNVLACPSIIIMTYNVIHVLYNIINYFNIVNKQYR